MLVPFSLKKVTPHSLRHAFASHAVDGNADLLVLKTILGHSSIKTTEIYLRPSIDTLKKAVNNHLANDVIKELRSKRVERSFHLNFTNIQIINYKWGVCARRA